MEGKSKRERERERTTTRQRVRACYKTVFFFGSILGDRA